MSAMAARAAWAQDPRSGQQRQQDSFADAATMRRAASGPLLDTPDCEPPSCCCAGSSSTWRTRRCFLPVHAPCWPDASPPWPALPCPSS